MKQRAIAIGIFWAFLLTLLAFRAPGFFEPANIRDMAVTNAPALIVAIGMTLVIVAGEIDVSVASQFAVLSVIAGTLAKAGLPLYATALLTGLAGALLGLVNGALVTRLGRGRQVRMPIPQYSKDNVLRLRDLIESSQYRAVIDRRYRLEEVVEATTYVETQQKVGNVVLTVINDAA